MSILRRIFKKKPNCWDTLSCGSSRRNKCPYYLNRNHYRCWEVEGTFCHSEEPESSARKLIICSQCDYFITHVWGLQPTAEHKNDIRKAMHGDIMQMAKISVNDTVAEVISEMKMLKGDSGKRIAFLPDKNVPKVFNCSRQLKNMVRNLVSQALESIPSDMEITITAKDHSGHEVKVVLTSPYPELLNVRPRDSTEFNQTFCKRKTEVDGNPWSIVLGKDRRQVDRRIMARRSTTVDSAAKDCRRKADDRRADDRRFALIKS